MGAKMLTYEDLQLVAALAREGTPVAASKYLNIHLATLYRRLKELECHPAGPLFKRVRGRYVLSSLGEELAQAAGKMEEQLAVARRRLAGGEEQLQGRVTVTTADSLVPLVTRVMQAFRILHPAIHFELVVTNQFADLACYEAEVAIRPTNTPPETWIGKNVGDFDYGIYTGAGTQEPLFWIDLDSSLSSIPAGRWLAKHVPAEQVVLKVNSMWAAAQAAASGVGKALLPDYLARYLRLQRLQGIDPQLSCPLWLLIHPDLRYTPRVQTFLRFATEMLRKELLVA